MKTALEVLEGIIKADAPNAYDLIKQYGRQCAEQALKDAADRATIWVETEINGTEFEKAEFNIGTEEDPYVETITVFKDRILSTPIVTP
jgi:hypothetical protein